MQLTLVIITIINFYTGRISNLENLASRVRYPHFPTSFENVLRVKFGNDCFLGEQQELVVIIIATCIIMNINCLSIICY